MKYEFKTPNGEWIPVGLVDEDYMITVDITISLSDLMGDYEYAMDIISEKATGTICLCGFHYKPVSVTKENDIVLRVTGDISDIINDDWCDPVEGDDVLIREVEETEPTIKREFKTPENGWVPLTDDWFIAVDIIIDPSAMIDHDLEGFLDLISDMVSGTVCLSEIDYDPVSLTEQKNIVLRVTGNVSMVIEYPDDYNELVREVKKD